MILEVIVFTLIASVVWWVTRNTFLLTPSGRFGHAPEIQQRLIRKLPTNDERRLLSLAERGDHWLQRKIALSRLSFPAGIALLTLICGSILAAVAAFVFTENLFAGFAAGILTITTAMVVLDLTYRRVISDFEKQLPLALDLMARAVTAGESLEQAIGLVADSMNEPVMSEFRRCQHQLTLGLSVRTAMESMTQRMDTLNVRIMSSILSAHRDSGGHLAETLQRLAQVIRNRFDYQRKLRSITSAGRASLFIVTALAWGIFIYLFAFQPSYGREFFNDPSGRLMLIVAFGLELIGVCWGWALLRQQY